MSVKQNYLFNLANQILTMALPLITVPYVSRVLKPEGVGIFSFTNSIIQFFILFGMLGIGVYGIKMIATVRDNKKKLSKTFISIYSLQFILTVFSVVAYVIFVNYFYEEHKTIAYLQVIALLATVIDCSWFFSGLEEFKKIVTRNIIIKIISLVAIFIFVKDQADVPIYTIIMGLSSFLGQLILWFHLKRYISPVRINIKSIFIHLKPTLVYFLPQIALQIYFVLNKTMLGIMSSNSEVGIFDYADKILKVVLAIVTSLGTVMLPRMASTFVKGDMNKAREYINKSLEFSTLLAIGLMFGLAGISKEMIPWYMGNDFIRTAEVLIILSPTIFFMAWSGVFGTQYLLPLGKIKQYTISVYIGALINVIINFILIKPYGAVGAAIGTLFSEIAVFIIQILFVKKEIKFKKQILNIIWYLISGIIMYSVIRKIGYLLGTAINTTIIQVISGSIIYICIVILFELIFKDGLILNEIKKRKRSQKL